MVIVIVGILAVMSSTNDCTDTISARESAEMVAADIRRTRSWLWPYYGEAVIFTAGSSSYTTGTQTVSLPAGVIINTTTTLTFSRLGYLLQAQHLMSMSVG